jgi:hypothetical protein
MNLSSNDKPKIFIGGGSWSMGEWAENTPTIQHKGFEQYFSDDGFEVVNTSKTRTYHSAQIDILSNTLHNKFVSGDVIFFVITDPLLDIVQPELALLSYPKKDILRLPKFTKRIEEAGGIKNLLELSQHQIYNKLNTVGKILNTQIYCIGGSFNLNTEIMSNYTNLTPIVPSWITLLVGQDEAYKYLLDNKEFGIIGTWNIDYVDLTQYSNSFSQRVVEEYNRYEKNKRILMAPTFNPDGNHPNRIAHRILYNYIQKELNF